MKARSGARGSGMASGRLPPWTVALTLGASGSAGSAGAFVSIYMALNWLSATASPPLAALFSAVETALLVFTMLRFGLVALIASFFVYVLLLMFPITADFSVWYAGASLFALLSVAAMAAFALRSSLGGTGFSL